MGIAKLTTTASCCAGRVYEGLFRLYFRVVPDGWLPITHYIGRWNMNAVGINVSKGKSMIAIMRPFREVVASPYEVNHTFSEFEELTRFLKSLKGETKVIMEYTGKYFEPVAKPLHEAGIFVSVVNAILVHDYGGNTLRRGKRIRRMALSW